MHPCEVRSFDFLNIDQFFLAPESNFGDLVIEGIKTEIDLFSWVRMDFELEIVKRDPSVSVYGSIHSETEDIFSGLKGRSDGKFSKERLFLFQCPLKAEVRDLLSRGVDLAVVISMDFLVQDPLGLLDFGDIFPDAGSDEPVLEPAIRPFDFASGLRGKGMSHLHLAVFQDLFPLGSGLIGPKVVLIPEGVPTPDKAEDGVGIDVIGLGEAMSKDHGLQGQNMGPAGLFLDQNGVEEEAAIIIEGGDQVPFFLGCRCPEMIGGVMLDQFSDIAG